MSAQTEIRAAFKEMLAVCGITIVHAGVTKKCISTAIETKRDQDVSGYLPESLVQVDMLTEDFAALGALEDRNSLLTIAGVDHIFLSQSADPFDPCVHLVLTKDR